MKSCKDIFGRQMAGRGLCGHFTTQCLEPVFSVRHLDGRGKVKTVHRNLLLPVRSVPTPVPSKPKSVLSQTPIMTWSRTRLRDSNDRAPWSDSSPESMQSHGTVSTVVPRPQTSVIAWKADSSLDLDEDETSVLLDESVVTSENGGTTDRYSKGEIGRLTNGIWLWDGSSKWILRVDEIVSWWAFWPRD